MKYNDNSFYENAESLFIALRAADKDKNGTSLDEITIHLNHLYKDYCDKCGILLDIHVKFDDVHRILGFQAHTELFYVTVNESYCEIIFHPRLIEHQTWESGFVFVYKSWVLLAVINKIVRVDKSFRANFLFEAGDNGEFESVSFCSRNPGSCLILDHDFARSGGYASLRKEIDDMQISWSERSSKFFWRGSTTGRRLHNISEASAQNDWSWLQRLNLCDALTASRVSSVCDVGITTIVQIDEKFLQARINNSGFIRSTVCRGTFSQYKYVFDVDGNSNAWSGLFCSLYGASCVVKVASYYGYRQWYYTDLVPWRNFVPVSRDLSDLDESLMWIIKHDAHVEQIAERGRDLARNLTFQVALEQSTVNLVRWLSLRS